MNASETKIVDRVVRNGRTVFLALKVGDVVEYTTKAGKSDCYEVTSPSYRDEVLYGPHRGASTLKVEIGKPGRKPFTVFRDKVRIVSRHEPVAAEAKSAISPALVEAMVKFYGTIEAAREAYKVARQEVRSADRLAGAKVAWVGLSGRINVSYAAEIQYSGSPDAPFVLPM